MGRQEGVEAERTAGQVIKTSRGSGDRFGRVGRVERGHLFSFCVSVSCWLVTVEMLINRLSSIIIYLNTREAQW